MFQRWFLISWIFIGVGTSALWIHASESISPGSNWENPQDRMQFVWIPAGSLMAEIPKDSTPVLERIAFPEGFWMGKTEVTVKQFSRFVQQTGYLTDAEKAGNSFTWKHPGFKQKNNHPVIYLSYSDALHYVKWANVDLPTEAEWIYACRAGIDTTFYWGNDFNDRYVWHRGNSEEGTHPVGRKQPNAWNLYDMVGNAWEYCKVGENGYCPRGGAWSRCFKYLTRQGFVAEIFPSTVAPRLSQWDPNPQNAPYPWDDDRGFRCIKRKSP